PPPVVPPPLPPPPVATTAVVSGTVFTDANRSGARNDGEAGRANVRVYLDLDNDGKRDAAEPAVLTGAAGQYRFAQAPARADLHVRLDLADAPRLRQSLPTNGAARVLTTVAGQTYGDQTFGVYEVPASPPVVPPPPPPVATGTIRGRVFADANRNGRLDAGESGVAGRGVYLDLNHNGYRDAGDRQAVTDAQGRYAFEKVAAGTYAVRLYRGDLTQTTPPNNGGFTALVRPGGTAGDLFFGTFKTGTPTPVRA
ncbi:MAG: Cna domain protein, partial [Phycisphaerales bacterium]|nr:Cna domain protein [Phycisphaerales bacterium]